MISCKELNQQIQESPDGIINSQFIASPDERNIFKWYFMVFNLPEAPYKGGFYIGELTFPQNYPFAPPMIKMLTENGRFKRN